ncbi:MAG: tetratricopeptide repeat protein [Gammaproteobacteria bacterium]|nr:tetratricopeptide repeat protein [Gammaproteobacteria bacterium]
MSRCKTLTVAAVFALCNAIVARATPNLVLLPTMSAGATAEYYTLVAEIALTRHESRVAALTYVSAATADPSLWPRATAVAQASLQPTVTLDAALHWISLRPDSMAAHLAAASAARALYQTAVAADNYRFLIAHYSGGVEQAFPDIEQRLLSARNPYAARAIADRLVAYFPDSVAAYRLQAYAALRAGDPMAAIAAFGHAIARLPGPAAEAQRRHRALFEAFARARVLAGDVDDPLAQAAATLEQEPRPGTRFDYGLLLLAAKRYDAARMQMQRLASDARFGPDALRLLALLDFQQGRDPAARVRFEQLLAGGHYVDDSRYYLGLIAERRGDAVGALRDLAHVRHGQYVLPAMRRAASILQSKGAGATADALLAEFIRDEPRRAPQIVAIRARVAARGGDVHRALALLDEAMRQYPSDPGLRYTLASIQDSSGDTAGALTTLRAVLAMRPDDPEAMNAYGYTLAEHGLHLARAQRLIETALEVAPEDAAMRDSLAWVLYRRGRAARALPIVAAAYADLPSGDIGAHYGEILWMLGRRAAAEEIWDEAAAIDPGNRLLQRTRARFAALRPTGAP